ncbi:hypothetical protein UT300003_32910 [Clostridium sardiniense]
MFFTISQNNSGGYFIRNDEVTETIIIEANSVEEAKRKAEDITRDYSQYCPCCGERWYEIEWLEYKDGYEEPCIYGEPISSCKASYYRTECIIYYLDGTKKKVKLK